MVKKVYHLNAFGLVFIGCPCYLAADPPDSDRGQMFALHCIKHANETNQTVQSSFPFKSQGTVNLQGTELRKFFSITSRFANGLNETDYWSDIRYVKSSPFI